VESIWGWVWESFSGCEWCLGLFGFFGVVGVGFWCGVVGVFVELCVMFRVCICLVGWCGRLF